MACEDGFAPEVVTNTVFLHDIHITVQGVLQLAEDQRGILKGKAVAEQEFQHHIAITIGVKGIVQANPKRTNSPRPSDVGTPECVQRDRDEGCVTMLQVS